MKINIFKVWSVLVLGIVLIILLLFGGITIYVDPYFHYHKPLEHIGYYINNQRYQNDGIVRMWEYDAIITGTSMTENFKTSECDELFGCTSIKVPFSGGRYKEINDNLEKAFSCNTHINMVIRSLDFSLLEQDKDAMRTDIDYPTYLTNDKMLDDVNYFFNKEILINGTIETLLYTKRGGKTTSFDKYANWNEKFEYGKEVVLNTYDIVNSIEGIKPLDPEAEKIIRENIQQNVVELALRYPETTFYCFFPPYSICYWDVLNSKGEIERQIEAEKCAIEELMKCPNIKLFCFYTNYELVCDLDNYKDQAHYGEWVNSDVLRWMANGEYLLTKDNYEEHIEEMKEFYLSYDYDSLHE